MTNKTKNHKRAEMLISNWVMLFLSVLSMHITSHACTNNNNNINSIDEEDYFYNASNVKAMGWCTQGLIKTKNFNYIFYMLLLAFMHVHAHMHACMYVRRDLLLLLLHGTKCANVKDKSMCSWMLYRLHVFQCWNQCLMFDVTASALWRITFLQVLQILYIPCINDSVR